MATPYLSVIIPNWSGERLLPACLDSLRKQSYEDFEVILVDNASQDGSLALVRKSYPEVKVVALGENRGLTGAANVGIEEAQGEVMVLLNNDTEAHPRWLEELASGLVRYPQVGMAACKILLYDRRDRLHSAGDYYRVNGIPDSRGVWERDEGQYDREEEVFAPCGGAGAYRRRMLEEIGLFDEDFFMYCEDVDLAWRAQMAGYRCIYIPTAIVHHRLSATGGGRVASYYTGRNTLYVIMKDYPGFLFKRHWPSIVGAQLAISWEALRSFRGEAARARLRGQLAAPLGLWRMLRKRRQVQKLRRVSSAYLETLLASSPGGES